MVMAVDKREDSAAYQSATARIAEMVAELANSAVQKKNFQEVRVTAQELSSGLTCSTRTSMKPSAHEKIAA